MRYGLKLVIDDIDPAYTLGKLFQQRQELEKLSCVRPGVGAAGPPSSGPGGRRGSSLSLPVRDVGITVCFFVLCTVRHRGIETR